MFDGVLQYRFDCGSGEGLVRLNAKRVDDGNWHTVSVERRGKQAEIILDNKYNAQSNAPGTNDVLNLDTNIIYVGAESDGQSGARRGFIGCIRLLKLNSVLLPYSGSSSVASFERFQNVEFTCSSFSRSKLLLSLVGKILLALSSE